MGFYGRFYFYEKKIEYGLCTFNFWDTIEFVDEVLIYVLLISFILPFC